MEFKEEIAHIGYRKDIKSVKQGNLWFENSIFFIFFWGRRRG